MANLENLTSRILEEAKVQSNEILESANAEKNKIIEKKVNEAKQLEFEILEKAKRESETRKERIISNAELQVRNKKLEGKQTIISKVFDEAVEGLCKLSKEEFLNFLKKTILNSDIVGDENLILNSNGKNIVSKEFISELNKDLEIKGKKGSIKLSNEIGQFKGGFILEKNGIEINNTFEALVSSMKDDLEYDVANVLFN
ncbi:V-type ATP synthase subunit E [Clostridium fallax]|uniref:V-type proton ATPase subunit E n=1 Tax=Clostridium fallax TaxID=1533 RepID=A0A1M4U511_9CLOT|nr:V-type ATP synthase subunit E family protein [Clostridium fallax]SHE51765.1 V/A-type H+-transporting ATPase subunit E [Clostridium fallax]SQB06081.1 ATP synthase (E/31 kDa) subunit [Clostridium fallax]